jgi:hypothetical protein
VARKPFAGQAERRQLALLRGPRAGREQDRGGVGPLPAHSVFWVLEGQTSRKAPIAEVVGGPGAILVTQNHW